ncbi:hypothetical protein [Roseovarius nanhaiticus]|uniref:Uncharacterized protein n=1 Tax=Roseovarius nanhaiticus TaxID=573024 RepID=A0A1N7HBY3_9RHOB|nr:hypothetical protein [Roseovarius nanhaiticus]SEL04602.1 hypothetical protein SAMN05216208_2638 [Roseovarius nanhaiticus]SIS22200.1 hypothetical protein SAMN05421666_2677 [Roseovarius nanhaiticus]
MTAAVQRRLAITGAFLAIGLFIAANAHLITVALNSQPDCTLSERAAAAKPAC